MTIIFILLALGIGFFLGREIESIRHEASNLESKKEIYLLKEENRKLKMNMAAPPKWKG